VYGDQAWVQRAKNDSLPSFKSFEKPPIPPTLPIADDFELDLLNQTPSGIYLSPDNNSSFKIVADKQRKGQCLKIQDHPGHKRSYYPHLNYRLKNKKHAIDKLSFDLSVKEDSHLIIGLRDYSDPSKYLSGPELMIKNKKLSFNQTQFNLPTNVWLRFNAEMTENGMNLIITGPELKSIIHNVPYASPEFKKGTWFGFSFPAKNKSAAYLDNVKISLK
jgi:hypothetical protein